MVCKSHTAARMDESKGDSNSWFGVRTFQATLESLMSLDDIDIDVLLLLRDEV